MPQPEPLVLTREPFMPALFAKAALKRGRKTDLANLQLPRLRVDLLGVKVDADRLGRYQNVCGFQDKHSLPITYPQILAFGAYMVLLTDSRFPLPLIGLVHLRNQITQQRPILAGEILDFQCELVGQKQTEKGLEFEIETRVYSSGSPVWESLATILLRAKAKRERRRRGQAAEEPRFDQEVAWILPEDLGRQYAKVSGDYNLIHLYALTAKLFGFKKPIVHGMWSKARCLAELFKETPQRPVRVEVGFKLPVFLPAEVKLRWCTSGGRCDFALQDGRTSKPHLQGAVTWI